MPFWYPVGGAFKRDAYAFGSTISAGKSSYDLRELACDFRAGHGFKLVKDWLFEAFPLEPAPGEVREGIGLARGDEGNGATAKPRPRKTSALSPRFPGRFDESVELTC